MGNTMNEAIEEYLQSMGKKAIEYANSFDVVFTYSEKDVKDLEAILNYYSNDLKNTKDKPSKNQIYSMSLIWGSYLGELIIKYINPKLSWVKEDVFGDGEIIHLQDGDTRIFPIDKVYKRLINGEVDSIISFYDVMKNDWYVSD
ncbi:hypothetical protein [Metabacillus sp. 22489]|uniref:hypothetical protein n=1 Tax=Metabacillus sp. 22489 TaxID=3453928 RepID=UPI003F837931